MRWNCISNALCFLQKMAKHRDCPVFTVFLTIKTSSQNNFITLLQISLKLLEHRGSYWRKKFPWPVFRRLRCWSIKVVSIFLKLSTDKLLAGSSSIFLKCVGNKLYLYMSHAIKIWISTGCGRLLDACLGVDVITKGKRWQVTRLVCIPSLVILPA